MNDDRKELKQVQQESRELTAKQVDLIEKRHQQPFYQRWFQQADPKLDSITAQIADLKRREGRLYDIIQVSYITNIRQLLQRHNQSQRKIGRNLSFIPTQSGVSLVPIHHLNSMVFMGQLLPEP
jgi:hypothetical protein